jgi:dienelactone hydrolase
MTDRDALEWVSAARVDGVPVAWVEPSGRRAGAPLALWLPWLGSSKEAVLPFLGELAAAGFVAVTLDPWQHGERGGESPEALLGRVFGDFRRHMWPILGQTALDSLRVVDWALAELGAGPDVVAGGVSMGGDVAVALAGADRRIGRVAAVVATPDWTRPGMTDLMDPSRALPQGTPDAYARRLYERLDPFTHLRAYARGPAIDFECAGDDTHVPADGALRFQAALRSAYPDAGERVRVAVHPGLDHLDGARSPALSAGALAWLRDGPPAPGAG